MQNKTEKYMTINTSSIKINNNKLYKCNNK